jgi:hypothetical protein
LSLLGSTALQNRSEIPEHRNSLEAIKGFKRPSILFSMPGDLPSSKKRRIERLDDDASRDVGKGDNRDVVEAKVENTPVAPEGPCDGKQPLMCDV